MHRSGTSTLAGTMRHAGVMFGHVLDRGFAHNPKGLQEAPAVLFMQEDLLRKNGGSWHTPPADIVWQNLHKSVRDLFIESRHGVPLWGFKDPRTLMTVEGWLEVLPDMQFAGIFRHPAEVAMSIHKRNEFPMPKCLEIWRRYNERLADLHDRHGFPMIEFVGDGAQMQASFARILAALDLPQSQDALDFYEAGLRTNELPDVDIPPGILNLYRRLQEMVV